MPSTCGPARVTPAARTALILFGPPGSGKGTQAKLLEGCLDAPHISTGDLLRDHIHAGDTLGQKVGSVMQAGMLVPDDLVNQLVEERIERLESRGWFILDGYPRTLPQAETLRQMLEARRIEAVVVHLKVDYNEIISRLSGRRQCPVCGTLYSLRTHPPKLADICDRDGARLVTRPDDSEPVIRQRLEEYEFQTRPLLDYFKGSGFAYYEVDGSAEGPRDLAGRICNLVAQER